MQAAIDVTAELIAEGNPRKCKECPVALSLKRTLQATSVLVVATKIAVASIKGSKVGFRDGVYRLPDAAYDFILAFDTGSMPLPLSFQLDDEIDRYV